MIPARKSRKGTRPGISDEEIRSLRKENEDDRAVGQWEGVRKELSVREKKKVFGKMMELAVLICMESHVY